MNNDILIELIEAASAVVSNHEHAFSGGMCSHQKGSDTWQLFETLRAANDAASAAFRSGQFAAGRVAASPAQVSQTVTDAVMAEREACAKECESVADHAEEASCKSVIDAFIKTTRVKEKLAEYKHLLTVQTFNAGIARCAANIRARTAAEPAPPDEMAVLRKAYELGFIRAGKWANREDLTADVDSKAFFEDRDRDLSPLPQTSQTVAQKADVPVGDVVLWPEKITSAERSFTHVCGVGPTPWVRIDFEMDDWTSRDACHADIEARKLYTTPQAPAPTDAERLDASEVASLIVRDVCETDPADPEDGHTVCISTGDLTIIIERNLAAMAAKDAT